MKRILGAIMVVGSFAFGGTANAWWDGGHMRIAAIAWDNLTRAAKTEASRLLKRNPTYPEWAAAVPANGDGTPGDVDRHVFIGAAI